MHARGKQNLEQPGDEIDIVGSTIDLVHLLNGKYRLSNPRGSTGCLPRFSPHVLWMGTVTADKRPGRGATKFVANSTRGSLCP